MKDDLRESPPTDQSQAGWEHISQQVNGALTTAKEAVGLNPDQPMPLALKLGVAAGGLVLGGLALRAGLGRLGGAAEEGLADSSNILRIGRTGVETSQELDLSFIPKTTSAAFGRAADLLGTSGSGADRLTSALSTAKPGVVDYGWIPDAGREEGWGTPAFWARKEAEAGIVSTRTDAIATGALRPGAIAEDIDDGNDLGSMWGRQGTMPAVNFNHPAIEKFVPPAGFKPPAAFVFDESKYVPPELR